MNREELLKLLYQCAIIAPLYGAEPIRVHYIEGDVVYGTGLKSHGPVQIGFEVLQTNLHIYYGMR